MSYHVLARKWRPSRLEDVVGQDHVVRAISGAIRTGRIPHAFLFCGPRGVGKTTLARLLAKALNCEKGPTAEPCGRCSTCQAIPTGACVDVLEIDGASHTSVDDVRRIIEAVQYAPASARFKVYIVDEVHMLSVSAFNALLKTLEEPPSHVKFVFATTDPQKIPATIVGRCQRFDFWRISSELIAAKLRKITESEKLEADPDALVALARFAEGSLRDAEVLLDQIANFAAGEADGKSVGKGPASGRITRDSVSHFLGLPPREKIEALLDALVTRDAPVVMTVYHQLYSEGFDLMVVAKGLLEEAHALLVCATAKDAAGRILQKSEEEMEGLARRAASSSQADLVQIGEILAQMCAQMATSSDPYVVATTALSKITLLPRLMDLGQIFGRLEAASAGGRTESGPLGPSRAEPVSRGTVTAPKSQVAATAPTASSFTEFVLAKNRMLGAVVKQSDVVLEQGRIVVCPPSGDAFSASVLEDKKKDLRAWAAEFYREDLDIVVGAPRPPSAASEGPKTNDEIDGHPMYKEFVKIFQPAVK
ncbi:MAG: DNA polymerase III subunit gamma/tau [Nitrospirae bacterium]|nr:DNA polymerase III subunit gamma/tau [Nitrospirota bacterium]